MSRRIPPQLRRQVWENYMNQPSAASGPCFVCGTTIHILNFECGHVVSYEKNGPTILENLRPICSSCNRSMGTMNLFEYKQFYFDNPELVVVPPKRTKKQKPTPELIISPVLEPIPEVKKKKPKPKPEVRPIPEIKKKKEKLGLAGLIYGIASWSLSETIGLSGSLGCQHRLIKGPRKGQMCGGTIYSKKYCKKHFNKYL